MRQSAQRAPLSGHVVGAAGALVGAVVGAAVGAVVAAARAALVGAAVGVGAAAGAHAATTTLIATREIPRTCKYLLDFTYEPSLGN